MINKGFVRFINLINFINFMNLLMKWLLSLALLGILCSREEVKGQESLPGAVITGRVLNREVYPGVRGLVLRMAYFDTREDDCTCRSDIAEDGTFCFSFQPYTTREVAIQTFVPGIIIGPGDSLHVEIDFKDLGYVRFSGPAGKVNREFSTFTGSYYSVLSVSTEQGRWREKVFLEEINRERAALLERREEYIARYKPSEATRKLTRRLLDLDYYIALFRYYMIPSGDGPKYEDFDKSFAFVKEAEKCFTGDMVLAGQFKLANGYTCVYLANKWALEHGKEAFVDPWFTIRLIREMVPHESLLYQYLMCDKLLYPVKLLNLELFEKEWAECEPLISAPFLREPLHERYRIMKDYQEHPEKLTEVLLRGDLKRSVGNDWMAASFRLEDSKGLPGMDRLREVIKRHAGEVVYINIWGTGCWPCIVEKKQEQELIRKFEPRGVRFVSLCTGDSTRWRDLIAKHHFAGEHYLLRKDEFSDIFTTMHVEAIPYNMIIDRQGNLIAFGLLSPAMRWTEEKLEELIGGE